MAEVRGSASLFRLFGMIALECYNVRTNQYPF